MKLLQLKIIIMIISITLYLCSLWVDFHEKDKPEEKLYRTILRLFTASLHDLQALGCYYFLLPFTPPAIQNWPRMTGC